MSSVIQAISQAGTTATSETPSAKSARDAMMGKEDFLLLLVAQLQNQDPLNPNDPSEFTAQLAQFSSLEQLFTLNEGMTSLVAANANSDRLSTLSTIGKDVAYYGADFTFSGEPVELGYQLDGPASEVTLTLSKDGMVIATLSGKELTAGSHYLQWDGLLENGTQAPVGDYTIALQAKATSEESVAAAPLIRAEVTGVDLGSTDGGTLITTAGEVPFNSILGVYERGSRTALLGGEAVVTEAEEEDESAATESASDTSPVESVAAIATDADNLTTLVE
jgi:flagellar basal-body rod modification protein FlgD